MRVTCLRFARCAVCIQYCSGMLCVGKRMRAVPMSENLVEGQKGRGGKPTVLRLFTVGWEKLPGGKYRKPRPRRKGKRSRNVQKKRTNVPVTFGVAFGDPLHVPCVTDRSCTNPAVLGTPKGGVIKILWPTVY